MTSNTNDMKTISLLFSIYLFIYGVFGDETERVSVDEGGSVTLQTDFTDKQRDDVIVWRFRGDRIAKINGEVNSDPVYDPDKRFTDRLKMNPQTADLTITDITSELTGLYQLEIDGVISPKAFNIIITEARERHSRDGEDVSSSKGPSSGVIAGICVPLLVLVIAAVVGVVIYRHCKMRHQDSRDEEESTEMQKCKRNGDASNGDVHPD